jgi:hypothetical protein
MRPAGWLALWLSALTLLQSAAPARALADEAAKAAALAEGLRLREEARQRAEDRIRQLQSGARAAAQGLSGGAEGAAAQASAQAAAQAAAAEQARAAAAQGQAQTPERRSPPRAVVLPEPGGGAAAGAEGAARVPPAGLDRDEVRRWEREQRRVDRERQLRELHEDKLRQAQVNDVHGRQLKEELERVQPTCADGVRNQKETDVDCGGDSCREKLRLWHGIEYPRACGFAQRCEVARDCASRRCDKGACAAREPFAVLSVAELERNAHSAFMQLAAESSPAGDMANLAIRADQIDRFFALVFNPDKQELKPEPAARLKAELEAFKRTNGLLAPSPTLKLPFGFLSRGASKDLMLRLIALLSPDPRASSPLRSEL